MNTVVSASNKILIIGTLRIVIVKLDFLKKMDFVKNVTQNVKNALVLKITVLYVLLL